LHLDGSNCATSTAVVDLTSAEPVGGAAMKVVLSRSQVITSDKTEEGGSVSSNENKFDPRAAILET
jgi:uncharacterized protein YfaS (alpha-2-macroglobulin family)